MKTVKELTAANSNWFANQQKIYWEAKNARIQRHLREVLDQVEILRQGFEEAALDGRSFFKTETEITKEALDHFIMIYGATASFTRKEGRMFTYHIVWMLKTTIISDDGLDIVSN